MLNQASFLPHLPKKIWISIFEKTGKHPSLCSVSQKVKRILEEIYLNLYRDYQALNHPYLNQILQKVNQNQAEMPALDKVRLLYEAVIWDIEQLPEEAAVKQSTLARYGEAFSIPHMHALAVWYMDEREAISLITCFQRIAKTCPAAHQFLKYLLAEDKIQQANRLRAWMYENTVFLQ